MEATVKEITIGNHKYLVDQDKNSIKRFNEKSKMWVTITFGGSGQCDSVVEDLIEVLTEEYIQQCLDTRKRPT